jgi:diguanylate cyclase (GGDEF)-like protein
MKGNASLVPPLDLFTVRAMTVITILMCCVAMLFAWRINSSVKGMPLFVFGLLCMGVGSCLGIVASETELRGLIVANWGFRFSGMIMVIQSMRVFRGFRVWPWALIVVFAAGTSALFGRWLFVEDSASMRTGVMSIAMAMLAADGSFSMFRRASRRERLTHWSTGLVFAFVATFLVIRGVAHFAGAGLSGSLPNRSVEIPATICGNIAFIGAVFGMLLASNARLRQAAERSALFDPLTQLPNRRFLEDRLQEAERRASERGTLLGVIYLDLDGFKQVNDTLGHHAGDELLRSVGAAMALVLRPGDCLARVGGDEFVAVVEDVGSRMQLANLAERLKNAIGGASGAGQGSVPRASFGVAVFPEDGSSVQDVMRGADTAMYLAKRRDREPGAQRRTG